MDTLRIPLFGMPEEGVEVAADLPVAALQPADGESFPGETVTLTGWLTPIDETYLFRGTAEGEFIHACDRCLAEARRPYLLDVLWAFEEGPPLRPFDDIAGGDDGHEESGLGDESSPQRFQNGVIDLSLPLWEELQLAAPEKYLCSEDCMGLCPKCGVNRNEIDCGCPTEDAADKEQNKGLAGLADMFPELTQEKPQE